MSENNFGGGFEDIQATEPCAENTGNDFDVHQIHNDIPRIKTPGPQIGPGFLKDKDIGSAHAEKNEKEMNMEKLERIKAVILETDIDLLNPANTYKLMADELESRDLFDDELKTDINYYFNQKLVYLYNKENLKSENTELTEELKRKKKEAAFAGAKSLHGIIEKLEKIEENGGDDEKIKEYWNSRRVFYLNLKEKDTEHLLNEEEMLMDGLQNAQKYGALAEKAARNLIKNSSAYIQEMVDKNESLKRLCDNGLRFNMKEASISDDVYSSIDFYLEVITKDESEGKDKVKYFPVQVKCGSIDSRRGEDEKTQEFILNNLVNVVDNKKKFDCSPESCYYEKKMTTKLNKFVDKALVHNGNDKGFFIILPRGKGTLQENGDIDEEIKEMFFEQFFEEISKLEFN